MNIKTKEIFFLREINIFFPLLICLLLASAVGLRPETVGTDTPGYIYCYVHHTYAFEYLFQQIIILVDWLSLPVSYFLSMIALVNFFLIVFLGKKLIGYMDHRVKLNTLLLLLGISLFLSPFFFAVMANVIRQGPAIFALFIFYLALVTRSNILTWALPLVIAFGFHRTSIIAIAFSPLVFFSYRTVFYVVLVTCCFYLCGFSEALLQLFSKLSTIDLYAQIYNYGGGTQTGYHMGRRLDFTLFTVAAGVTFNFIGNRFLIAEDKIIFSQFVKIYWVLILPFFFFGFAAYSDRYLLPGWLFLSVLGAVFIGFKSRLCITYMHWLYCSFVVSAVYFVLKVQGILVFKLR